MQNLIIIGLGKTAAHLSTFIREYNLFNIKGYAVDNEYYSETTYNNLPVYELEALETKIDMNKDKIFVAMMWNNLNQDRKSTYLKLKERGFNFANIISPNSFIRIEIQSDNCWVHDNVIIQNDVELGSNNFFMANTLIGANSKIRSHCFFATKCTVAGGCEIGEQTFVGINATVFDDTRVGKKCIVGACTSIKRNVPDFTSIRSKSEYIQKTYSEEEIIKKLNSRKNVR